MRTYVRLSSYITEMGVINFLLPHWKQLSRRCTLNGLTYCYHPGSTVKPLHPSLRILREENSKTFGVCVLVSNKPRNFTSTGTTCSLSSKMMQTKSFLNARWTFHSPEPATCLTKKLAANASLDPSKPTNRLSFSRPRLSQSTTRTNKSPTRSRFQTTVQHALARHPTSSLHAFLRFVSPPCSISQNLLPSTPQTCTRPQCCPLNFS
jgi:hypothetical protein